MKKTKPVPLTKEEIDSIITASANNPFYFLLFSLAKITGRRLGEFYGIEEKEKIGEKVVGKKKVYDKDGNLIEINKKIPIMKPSGKFSYGMQVKDIIFKEDGTAIMKTWVLKRRNYIQDETIIPEDVTSLLKNYIRKNKLSLEDYLFRKVGYRSIQHAVKAYACKAGVNKNVSFHNFRHYFITYMLKKGWSYDKIAKLTGHKSIQSLGSYDHVIADDLKDRALEDLKGI